VVRPLALHAFLEVLEVGLEPQEPLARRGVGAALDAVGRDGRIGVSAVQEDEGEEKRVRVVVEDTGHGIAAVDLPRIFDPFYTTKPPGKGTGLGLMVVSQLVTDYGGTIGVRSTVGKGTAFTVVLPCTEEDRVEEERSAT
jgi:signal transduction histidine kinase